MGLRMTEEELNVLLKRGSVRIHEEKKGKPVGQKGKRTARKNGKTKDEFQSLAEQRYYEMYVQPLELAGMLDHWSMHESFVVEEGLSYQGMRFRPKIYSPDFMLYFKDGSVLAVEVKGSRIKKLQREYPLKKQLFIRKYCIPNKWDFSEVKAETLTGSGGK